jgi:hypothetical protein
MRSGGGDEIELLELSQPQAQQPRTTSESTQAQQARPRRSVRIDDSSAQIVAADVHRQPADPHKARACVSVREFRHLQASDDSDESLGVSHCGGQLPERGTSAILLPADSLELLPIVNRCVCSVSFNGSRQTAIR